MGNTLKAIIIDDEQHCHNRLLQLLNNISGIEVVNAYFSVDDALANIHDQQIQVVFLDVQIADKTGFDFLKALPSIPFEVIFTTAFDKYAVQAFKFSAVDYLLKPIDAEELMGALSKVNQKLAAKDFSRKMDTLFSNLVEKDPHKKVSIPTADGFEFVELSEIIRCQGDVNYTHIYLKNNYKITVSKTLKYFEELFAEANFFRVHNSHLINLAYIKKYAKGKGGYVTMADNTHIEVSTRRKDEFLKLMAQ